MVNFHSYVSLPEGTKLENPCFMYGNVGKTMSCLPPMTGNGKFIPPIYGEFGDALLL